MQSRLRLLRALIVSGLGLAGCGPVPSSQATIVGRSARSVGPVDLMVVPDDKADSILDAIRGARRRVLVEMYMLTAPDAVSALLAARAAGAEVRVLLEPAPYGDPGANQPAFAALAAAGIDVRWTARSVGLVHAKLIALDDTAAFIMTLNLTGAGLGSNREYVAIDRDSGDVGWAERVWNADAIGGDSGPPPAGARLLVSPVDARSRLGASIDAATASIQIEIEELSDTDLVDRLIAARTSGIEVSIVAPAANRSPATTAALGRLAAAGATVRVLARPVVHAKAMVVDGLRAYVGSMNFTRASLDDNREFGLLLDDPASVARIGATIATDSAAGLAF